MKTVRLSIAIDAPAAHVWYALWEDKNYRRWTSVFTEGSYRKGEMAEGARIHFLRPDGKGMFSDVSKLEPEKLIEFTHLGSVVDFIEIQNDPEFQAWAGAKEKYLLDEKDGKTTLTVSADTDESYLDYMNNKLNEGLRIVKTIAEPLWIEVGVEVDLPIDLCWTYFTSAEHIVHWNFASDDWYCPRAQSELRQGGSFNYRMEARDASQGFDLKGTFIQVASPSHLSYQLEDGRLVEVDLIAAGDSCLIKERFMAERFHSPGLQAEGWQSILHSFNNYCKRKKHE